VNCVVVCVGEIESDVRGGVVF